MSGDRVRRNGHGNGKTTGADQFGICPNKKPKFCSNAERSDPHPPKKNSVFDCGPAAQNEGRTPTL